MPNWNPKDDNEEELLQQGNEPMPFNGLCDKDAEQWDEISQPKHYTVGGFEAIDVVRAKLTHEEFVGFCKGNVLKYLMRANYKEHHDKDIGKAEWYMKELNNAIRNR